MRFLTNGLSGREPLLIDPSKAKDHAVLADKFGFTDMLAQLFGQAPKPYVVDGIGIVPVVGVIGKGLSPMEKMMGAVDIDEVSAALDLFASDPSVEKVALQISSPGGTVTGVEELANKVRSYGPDYSKAAEMQGIKMVVIKSGKFKGAGIEGTSLDENQMGNLQASVDTIHAEFKEAVNMKRKMVKAEAMEGQVFSGKQAAAQGLVTGLADSFNAALRSF